MTFLKMAELKEKCENRSEDGRSTYKTRVFLFRTESVIFLPPYALKIIESNGYLTVTFQLYKFYSDE